MPPPVVRSPLGLPLGGRGLLPLPDALPVVGAGVVAGGPYTLPILKGCCLPLPEVSNRTGAHRGHVSNTQFLIGLIDTFTSINLNAYTVESWSNRARAVWPRTAPPAGPIPPFRGCCGGPRPCPRGFRAAYGTTHKNGRVPPGIGDHPQALLALPCPALPCPAPCTLYSRKAQAG